MHALVKSLAEAIHFAMMGRSNKKTCGRCGAAVFVTEKNCHRCGLTIPRWV